MRRSYRWGRVAALVFGAAAMPLGFYAIMTAHNPPRIAVAFAGILGVGALAVAGAVGLLLWMFVTEYLRPAIRLRKPLIPLSLTSREASMLGERRYRHHPITFWGVLTLNDSFAFGFMLFGKPERETLHEKPLTNGERSVG